MNEKEKQKEIERKRKNAQMKKRFTLKAPNVTRNLSLPEQDVLRRTKVRELRRMGYTSPREIMYALQKGIEDSRGKIIKVSCTITEIKDDLEYLVQEDLTSDESLLSRRAVLLDQLRDLYRRAHSEYQEARGPMRNTFLNTTFAILKSIIEMEGVLNFRIDNEKETDEQQVSSVAKQLQKLSKHEKQQILSVLRKIADDRSEQGTVEEADVLG
jgi:hypothetical protein